MFGLKKGDKQGGNTNAIIYLEMLGDLMVNFGLWVKG
jgi:hypothetical protein